MKQTFFNLKENFTELLKNNSTNQTKNIPLFGQKLPTKPPFVIPLIQKCVNYLMKHGI